MQHSLTPLFGPLNRGIMHLPSRRLVATAVVTLFTSGLLLGGPVSVPSQATTVTKISWKGYGGAKPGMSMSKAAENLGAPQAGDCGGGPDNPKTISIDGLEVQDQLGALKTVQTMQPGYGDTGQVVGPLGLKMGMSVAAFKQKAKDQGFAIRHKDYTEVDAGYFIYWIKGANGKLLAFGPKTGNVDKWSLALSVDAIERQYFGSRC